MWPCSLPSRAVAEGLEVADNPYPAPPWHILASLQAGEEGVSTLSVYLYYTRETLGSFRSKTSCSSFRSTFKVCMSVLLRKCYQLFHKNLQFPSDVFHKILMIFLKKIREPDHMNRNVLRVQAGIHKTLL